MRSFTRLKNGLIRCCRCRQYKTESEYHRHAGRVLGVADDCKECVKIRARGRREKIAKYMRSYRKKSDRNAFACHNRRRRDYGLESVSYEQWLAHKKLQGVARNGRTKSSGPVRLFIPEREVNEINIQRNKTQF